MGSVWIHVYVHSSVKLLEYWYIGRLYGKDGFLVLKCGPQHCYWYIDIFNPNAAFEAIATPQKAEDWTHVCVWVRSFVRSPIYLTWIMTLLTISVSVLQVSFAWRACMKSQSRRTQPVSDTSSFGLQDVNLLILLSGRSKCRHLVWHRNQCCDSLCILTLHQAPNFPGTSRSALKLQHSRQSLQHEQPLRCEL